jgi:hypothetical protein
VRHPLQQETPRWCKAIERAVDNPQIPGCDVPQLRMYLNTIARHGVPQWRAPHVNVIAGPDQPFRHELRVITHAPDPRRVLARNDVPARHFSGPPARRSCTGPAASGPPDPG